MLKSLVAGAACATLLIVATSAPAQTNPFVGTWKLNQSKSHASEQTFRITDVGGGEYEFSGAGISYRFKTDGQAVPAGDMGGTATWKQVDASTWQITWAVKGKTWETNTARLSADGKTLTFDTRRTKVDGGTVESSDTFHRVGEGRGVPGTWKGKPSKLDVADRIEITPADNGGLAVKFSDSASTYEARFDGKQYPFTGPMQPGTTTVASKKTGPRAFESTFSNNAKPVFTLRLTLSDDNTLTEEGVPPTGKEGFTAVYERVKAP